MDSLKFHPGPAMPDPATPYGQPTPETALWPFPRWPARRTGILQPSSTPLDTPRRTPLADAAHDPLIPAGRRTSVVISSKNDINDVNSYD
jgi:hypothetical protein